MRTIVVGTFTLLTAVAALAQDPPAPGKPPVKADKPVRSDPLVIPVPPALIESKPTPVRPQAETGELNRLLDQLRSAREALKEERRAAERDTEPPPPGGADENARLRLRLAELLSKFRAKTGQNVPEVPGVVPGEPAPLPEKVIPLPAAKTPAAPTTPPLSLGGGPLDPLALGNALFQAGEHEDALRAYRLVSLEGKRAEERAPIQYLMATCLRKLGRTSEAVPLYQEVAGTRGDEVLAECAQWQLGVIRWRQDVQNQIQKMRDRRLAAGK